MTDQLAVVILISGRGSNMQAIVDQARAGRLDIDIRAVISNRPQAEGLKLAQNAGINTEVIDHRQFARREDFDSALQQMIDRYEPGLVVLAGFMRILSEGFVHHYMGRMLNIHPSLLPDYPGLHTHRRVLENGDDVHGASVHFVTNELDGGPVVLQARVPVKQDDTEQQLAQRVLQQEHRIYTEAIRWFAEGRLQLDNHQVLLDEQPLIHPVVTAAD